MPATTPNKVQFGISNVYYAVITGVDETTGNVQYATPVKMPGAENLAVSNGSGSNTTIYADNIDYYTHTASAGKTGELQMAKFPKQFLVDVLGQTAETGGGVSDSPNDRAKEFALLFQTEGDVGGKRYCWYRCTATPPTATHATNTDTVTEGSETSTITASAAMVAGVLKTTYSCEEMDENYANFFAAVPLVTAGA